MIRYESECVGCPDNMGCLGHYCPYSNIKHLYCDRCHKEFDASELKEYCGNMYCDECVELLEISSDELNEISDDCNPDDYDDIYDDLHDEMMEDKVFGGNEIYYEEW